MGEIMNDPNSITDKEAESFKQILETLHRFKESMKAYEDVDIHNNNNTSESIFKRHSNEYYVMSIVLESFFYCNSLEISFKQLNSMIYKFSHKDMAWDTSVSFVNAIIAKMIFLSLIEPIKTDDEHIPNFRITEEGIKSFQDHRFQNLAATSFSNYQSFKTNEILLSISEKSLLVSKKSFHMAMLSAIVAFIAFVVSIMDWVISLVRECVR